MRKLLIFLGSLLKNCNSELAFIMRNIDIKLHLSNCKQIFWGMQMQPVGLSQPHFQAPCLLLCTQFFESDHLYHQKFQISEFVFSLLFNKPVDVVNVCLLAYALSMKPTFKWLFEIYYCFICGCFLFVLLSLYLFESHSSQNDGNILLFHVTKIYFSTVITV